MITLAAADSLAYLSYPQVPIVLPNAVFHKATRDSAKLGAQSIMDWVKAHHTQIEIAVTNAYLNFDATRSINPRAREPELGERAAVEVIEEPGRMQGDDKAILLCKETAVTRRIVVRKWEKIIELSIMDFLKLLESEQYIQLAMPSLTVPLPQGTRLRGSRSLGSMSHRSKKGCKIRCGLCIEIAPGDYKG